MAESILVSFLKKQMLLFLGIKRQEEKHGIGTKEATNLGDDGCGADGECGVRLLHVE